MPRGRTGKHKRNHRRACAAGHSTRSASGTGQCQSKGKKYGKGEIVKCMDVNETQMDVVYDGQNYTVSFILHIKSHNNTSLQVTSIYPIDILNKGATRQQIIQSKITPKNKPILCKNIMDKFMNKFKETNNY